MTNVDKLTETLSVLILLFMWLGLAAIYSHLPAQIPVHFNHTGNVDAEGEKPIIWLLPTIAAFLYALITMLNKRPHIFNYSEPVTEQNARQLYTKATQMMRWLKLAVLMVLGSVLFFTIRAALRQHLPMPQWLFPAAIGVVCAPFVVAVFQHVFYKKK